MNEENTAPTTMEQLLQNAEDNGLAMAATAMPEQIENVRRRNELFDKGLDICPNCAQESRRELDNCEFCGRGKLPF